MSANQQLVKGYGKFITKDNYIYRTQAYLQWGMSEKTIGTVIMLNPGNASEKGGAAENELQHHEVKLDPTMRSIISVIEEAYKEQQLEGRVYIYNLFALQNPKDREAIRFFDELWFTNEPLICDLPLPKEKLLQRFNEGTWIWLAWGCNESSEHLKNKKQLFLSVLRESSAELIGLPGKTELAYYHPLARIKGRKGKLVEQFKQYFNRSITI